MFRGSKIMFQGFFYKLFFKQFKNVGNGGGINICYGAGGGGGAQHLAVHKMR